MTDSFRRDSRHLIKEQRGYKTKSSRSRRQPPHHLEPPDTQRAEVLNINPLEVPAGYPEGEKPAMPLVDPTAFRRAQAEPRGKQEQLL
jgi:hypothetical protein